MTIWRGAVMRCRYTTFTRSFCNKIEAPSTCFEEKGRNVQWVFLGCPGVGKGTYAARLSKLVGVPHISTGDLVRLELSSHGPLASQLVDIVNQGRLISDEIIIDLLSKRLEAGQAKGETGFILDGFPRTIRQAANVFSVWNLAHGGYNEYKLVRQYMNVPRQYLRTISKLARMHYYNRFKRRVINSEILEGVTDIDLVINLKLREDALIAKCLGRRSCSECGGNYNVACIDIKSEDGKTRMYMPPLLPPPHCETKLITRADDTENVVKERLRIYHETSQPVEDFYRRRGKLLEFDLPGGIPESWPKLLQALNLYDDENKKSAAA